MNGESVDEATLIERARNRDESALRALYEAHAERVHRLAYRMTGDEDWARDLTQEVFVRAFRKLDQFRGEASFGTWLHRVGVSTILNGRRRLGRHRDRERELDDATHRRVAGDGVDHHLRLRLERAVEALPDRYRAVVVMHDVEGFTHEEIAGTLGVAVGTSRARLSRARERLRAELADLVEAKGDRDPEGNPVPEGPEEMEDAKR